MSPVSENLNEVFPATQSVFKETHILFNNKDACRRWLYAGGVFFSIYIFHFMIGLDLSMYRLKINIFFEESLMQPAHNTTD